MQALFDAVNAICAKIQIVSNWFWDFPCNLDWYGSIPILGNFSLAIILLVGTGIYFTFRLHFVQVHNFIFAVKVLMQRNHTRNGISSLTAFLLSTAMRVGPGNILGVTGAISIGGPGALFWMWFPPSSAWQRPLQNPRFRRFARKSAITNMSAACPFTHANC